MAAITPRRHAPTDYPLFLVTLALLAIGLVVVFDAGYARAMDMKGIGSAFYDLKRQAQWTLFGFVGMLLAMRCGYWKLRRFAVPLLFAALLLLCLVWVHPPGIVKHGAARWIGVGPFQMQPSEFAKLALALYLAALLSRRAFDITVFNEGLIAPLLVIGLVALLVEREPDLGTAAVIGLAGCTMLFLVGARKRHLLAIGAVAVLFILVSSLRHGYRMERIKVWLNPEAYEQGAGYQIVHGLIAVSTPGPKGLGLGAGREKLYLPEPNTDFVFATIVEETGLWGSLLVMGLLLALGWRAIVIALRTRDLFGRLLATGIGALISWQAIINIAVVTNSIPATGVPLPFISYGGSSLFFLVLSVGILLNIAQYPDANKAEKVEAVKAS